MESAVDSGRERGEDWGGGMVGGRDERTFHARELLRRVDVERRGEDRLAVIDIVAARVEVSPTCMGIVIRKTTLTQLPRTD